MSLLRVPGHELLTPVFPYGCGDANDQKRWVHVAHTCLGWFVVGAIRLNSELSQNSVFRQGGPSIGAPPPPPSRFPWLAVGCGV